MKIRKMGLSFAPKNRAFKINNSYSIDEVCSFLAQYLNDDFELTNDIEQNDSDSIVRSKRKRRKHNKNKTSKLNVTPFDGSNEVQALMLSAAIIGTRVILKYCKGDKPHWMRAQIWNKSLKIADYFEKTGQLKTKRIQFFVRNDYIFLCRLYDDIEGIGTVVLPETKPFKFLQWISTSDGSNDIPGPFLKMPPLMNNTDGRLKKEATKLIIEYNELQMQ